MAVEAGEKKMLPYDSVILESSLSTILSKKVRLAIFTPYSSRMNERKGEYLELEECLVVCRFTQSRHNNISIGALPILKKKAKLFAISLGITNFLAIEGWLEKLRKRHDLTIKKVCGESASVNPIILIY